MAPKIPTGLISITKTTSSAGTMRLYPEPTSASAPIVQCGATACDGAGVLHRCDLTAGHLERPDKAPVHKCFCFLQFEWQALPPPPIQTEKTEPVPELLKRKMELD